ncbi:hypothetical protein [uncultured Algoriphagus sp.]|uniref:hypothetical protein n=1 Tax=uncultured Algoriphagus sp. TaxID=417365 RepID=UPI0030ED2E6A|tara:strand:+ start:202588 stop:203673 length:1086 start_codon:yes stop_codon:yes gene_type:complete
MVKKIQTLTSKSGIDNGVWEKFFSYFIPYILGIIFAGFKDRISGSIRLFFQTVFSDKKISESYVDWLTSIYILITFSFLFWLVFYYGKRNKTGNEKMDSAISDIKNSIYKAPNIKIFDQYGPIYKSIMKSIWLAKNAKIPISKEAYEMIFINVLDGLRDLISRFSNIEKSKYSADLMIFIKTENDVLIKELEKNKTCIRNYIKIEYLKGVLTNLPEIYSFDGLDNKNRQITIPIINERKINLSQVPGSGLAFLKGEYYCKNTLDSSKEYDSLPEKLKDDVVKYYEKNRNFFNSFASFSLICEGEQGVDVVGTLNIYFKDENILGSDATFHSTFEAFALPILNSLAYELRDYVQLYYNSKLN